MELKRKILLDDLKSITKELIVRSEYYKTLSNEELNFRSEPDSWSILECLEHLNRYGEFYLPEIEKRMLSRSPNEKAGHFRPGWLGNYFAGMMQIKDGKVKKIKTLKNMNPIHSELSSTTIDRFIKQQQQMLRLLDHAKNVDLTAIKTDISIGKLIKMRLGDTFRFVIYHNQRHIIQADKVVEMMEKKVG